MGNAGKSIIKRIDPEDCRCDDCLTGYSRPLDQANLRELQGVAKGLIEDATGLNLSVRTVTFLESEDFGRSFSVEWES